MDDPFKYGLLAALAIALLVAAVTDLRSRHIGNWLNGGIALAAPLFWWASDLALWPDVALQLGVALATFAVLAVLFDPLRGRDCDGRPVGAGHQLSAPKLRRGRFGVNSILTTWALSGCNHSAWIIEKA